MRNSILLVILAVFLIVKSFFLFPLFSDENIYINMSHALLSGLLPYKDFFYAHPPFQLILLLPSVFGFEAVKIYIAAIGVASVFLSSLIARILFGKKAAVVAFFVFLLYPGFLIFGTQAMGIIEASFLFLIGFYLLLKNKIKLSVVFFVLSFFTRYIVVLLLPLVLIFMKIKKMNCKKFLFYATVLFFVFTFVLYGLFGSQFVIDTVFYHLSSNIRQTVGIAKWLEQYIFLGYFTIFLSIFALSFGLMRKDKPLILFAVYPLFYDLTILLLFRQVIYHYFLPVLPFLFIAVGKVFSNSKYKSLKFFISILLVLCWITNLRSLEFYFSKQVNKVFFTLANYTLQNTLENDTIFGEPRTLNYVSFVTGRKVLNNYFDSDLKFVNFVGKEKIFSEIKKAKPKLMFADQFYVDFFIEDYKIVKEWDEPGYFNLFLMELKSTK